MPKVSIFYKILTVMIGLSISYVLLVSVFSTWIKTSRIEKSLLQENMKLAEIASKSIEAGYLIHNWPLETLKQIGESKNVLFWWLVKPDGEIYLANSPEFFGKIIDDPSIGTKKPVVKDSFFYKTKEEIKLIAYPVNIGDIKKPWTFYLGVSEKPILDARKRIINTNIFLLHLLGFTSFAGFLSFFLARTITDPIKVLRNATAKIAKGEFVKVKVKSKDEFGELAKSFNKMVEDLKKSQERLKERTKELREKVKELERFQKLTVGRELRMIELKKEIEKLKNELKDKNKTRQTG